VRLTCDGNSGEVLQSMEYLPSGVTYNQRNYSMQPYRFCGKEEVTLHGFDMYDSQARWQYSLIPRFSSMDPLAEVTCYSTALTAIGHAKYRHRLYRVGRDKARQSEFYHLSPYAYCAGDPDKQATRLWWDVDKPNF